MDLEGTGASNKLVGSMRSVLTEFRGVRLIGVACLVSIIGGCAIIPQNSQTSYYREAPIAERDYLSEAVSDVKVAPWPKPQQVSFVTRIAGGGGKARVTRSDAIDAYLVSIQTASDPMQKLANDAHENLAAADRLDRAAVNAMSASRLSMNDVALVEDAIVALREHGQIYTASVKSLKRNGIAVDEASLVALRKEYHAVIKQLGKTADRLAEQVEHDRTQTFATPKHLPDL